MYKVPFIIEACHALEIGSDYVKPDEDDAGRKLREVENKLFHVESTLRGLKESNFAIVEMLNKLVEKKQFEERVLEINSCVKQTGGVNRMENLHAKLGETCFEKCNPYCSVDLNRPLDNSSPVMLKWRKTTLVIQSSLLNISSLFIMHTPT